MKAYHMSQTLQVGDKLKAGWLACNTYPDAFADYPLGDTIKEYYKTWYGYDVTDDELEEMLLY